MSIDLASLQATVHGRVQGVFFRDFVATYARELRLTGYVRNLRDGSVEIYAEGERPQLEKLVERVKIGPSAARVSKVITRWLEYTGDYSGFRVTY